MLLVIDNIPFSAEIWEYMFTHREVAGGFETSTHRVHPGMHIFCPNLVTNELQEELHTIMEDERDKEGTHIDQPEDEESDTWIYYRMLPFYKIWTMYYKLYQLSMDLLVGDGLDVGVITRNEFVEQMEYLEEAIIYWALSTEHDLKEMVPSRRELELYRVEDYLLTEDRTSTSRAFEVEVYYMSRVMKNAVMKMDEILAQLPYEVQDMGSVQIYDPMNTDHLSRVDTRMKEIIRKHYELDEFINEVMTFVVESRMTEDHKGIAYIRGYVLLGEEDMETDLPMPEVWRRLFPFYFDDFEDYFDDFYSQFTRLCIEHVYRYFFKKKEMPWYHVPFYNVFVLKESLGLPRVVEDIRYFIEMDTLNTLYYEQVES